ncbi:MAG: tRNA lysidine(34) synthetase TilS [Candidatus Binatia bacterium]
MQRKASPILPQRVRRTVTRHAMLVPGDRVLVAVSGGPDSVALLGALVTLAEEFRISLCAAHLNHGLRGAESVRDQACAEEVAERLGVPCVVGVADALHRGSNVEARARQQRYAFLSRAAGEQRCTKIATGHTMDDQAETMLMRLLRGTGSDGLAGILAVREGSIIRPLIECSRAEVLAFVRAHELSCCADSSNHDLRFFRNRIRHQVMPLLESISPMAKRNLAAAGEILGDEAAFLREHDARLLAVALAPDGSLAVSALVGAAAPLRARLVRAWLRERRGDLLGLSGAHFRAIVNLAHGPRPNGRVRLPGGQWVVREYGCLRYPGGEEPSPVETERLLVPGSAVYLQSGWRIRAEMESFGRDWRRPADLFEAVADAAAVAVPLVVRTARPGDRIQPLGMRGHRKLQDALVDRKLPLKARRSCPVVELNGEIFWVPGIVRSNHALVTSDTRSALRLIAQKTGVAGT